MPTYSTFLEVIHGSTCQHMPTYSRFLGVIFFPEYKMYLYLRSPQSARIRLSVEMFDFELDQWIQHESQAILHSFPLFSCFSFQKLTRDARGDYLYDQKDC